MVDKQPDSSLIQTESRPVTSTQTGPHPRLAQVVRRHLSNSSRRQAADHTRRAFESIASLIEARAQPLIFDSFCGTGMSTALLASQHPDSFVIGIDKSAHRLQKHSGGTGENYTLVRGDCGDFWRLALAAGWSAQKHYMLYPNPWPKPGHLQRRIHGSADLSNLLALGGDVELRSNWQLYCEEFGVALVLAGLYPHIDEIKPKLPLTLFERKYLHSGHPLWRCRCQLGQNGPPGQLSPP